MSATGFQRRRRELAKNGRQAETRNAERQTAKEELAENKTDEDGIAEKSFNELRAAAKEREIEGYGKMNKQDLIDALEVGD